MNYKIDKSSLFRDNSLVSITEKLKNGHLTLDELLTCSLKSYQRYDCLYNSLIQFHIPKHTSKLDHDPLFGVPFVAKDIMNTKGFKTQMGSLLWKDFEPGNNARLVDSIINKGGTLIGKSVTSEFAIHSPNITVNPYNKNHKVGTSSSGSAVSVATGIVPFALATQTGGSITRPASFCGVFGMKPTYGLIPRTGILKTTDTLDNPGFISSQLYSLKLLLECSRVRGENYPYVFKNIDCINYNKNPNKFRIGLIKTPVWSSACDYVKLALSKLIEKIKAQSKYEFVEIQEISELDLAHQQHSTIYDKCISHYFAREYSKSPDLVSNPTRNMIERGLLITPEAYSQAISYQSFITQKINLLLSEFDAVLSIATSSSAPLLSQEELPDPSLIWTMTGVPSICVPLGNCPKGLPFGVQFISSKYSDFQLINCLEQMADDHLIQSSPAKLPDQFYST